MKHCDKRAVTVNVTSLCNLRCTYCMASSPDEQVRPRTVDRKFAMAGIRDAINGHPTGHKADRLRFFSPGEPTQDMETIVSCVDYARSLMPDIKTELQTNGVFPSKEARDWIANNFDVVWFSLDGPAEINDTYRPAWDGRGRTQEAEGNLKVVGAKTRVGVRSTIVEETMDHQEKLVAYYHSLGVRHLCVNPLIRPIKRNDKGNTAVNLSSQLRFAKAFVKAFPLAKELGVEFMNSMTFNFDEATTISCRSCLPMPQLNPDGSVSSCDMAMFSDTKEELKHFLYGLWDEKAERIIYDAQKIERLQNHRLERLPKCRECPIGAYCAGGCIGRRAYQTGELDEVLPDICGATIYMAKHLPLGHGEVSYTHP